MTAKTVPIISEIVTTPGLGAGRAAHLGLRVQFQSAPCSGSLIALADVAAVGVLLEAVLTEHRAHHRGALGALAVAGLGHLAVGLAGRHTEGTLVAIGLAVGAAHRSPFHRAHGVALGLGGFVALADVTAVRSLLEAELAEHGAHGAEGARVRLGLGLGRAAGGREDLDA